MNRFVYYKMDLCKMSLRINSQKMCKIILPDCKKASYFQILSTMKGQDKWKYWEFNLHWAIFCKLCTKIFDKLHCAMPQSLTLKTEWHAVHELNMIILSWTWILNWNKLWHQRESKKWTGREYTFYINIIYAFCK